MLRYELDPQLVLDTPPLAATKEASCSSIIKATFSTVRIVGYPATGFGSNWHQPNCTGLPVSLKICRPANSQPGRRPFRPGWRRSRTAPPWVGISWLDTARRRRFSGCCGLRCGLMGCSARLALRVFAEYAAPLQLMGRRMAKPSNLAKMSVETLLEMRDEIGKILSGKVGQLQSQLAALGDGGWVSSEKAVGRPKGSGNTLKARRSRRSIVTLKTGQRHGPAAVRRPGGWWRRSTAATRKTRS